MHHARIVAGRAGKPLTGFLTLTPLRSVPDTQRRALFQDQRSRLGQRLARAPFKLDFVGIFVREKKAADILDAGEHCAALLWLPQDIDTNTLLRCLSPEIDPQLDWNNGEAGIKARVDYLQKERCGQAEGYLKAHKPYEVRYPREEPAPIVGARWSKTRGLDALISADAEQHDARKFCQLGAIPLRIGRDIIAVAAAPLGQEVRGQGTLFSELSDMRAPDRLSAAPRHRDKIAPVPMLRLFTVVGNVDILDTMRALGPTHEAIAERLGISRPQVTNILNTQFRPSRAVVKRILELAKAA